MHISCPQLGWLNQANLLVHNNLIYLGKKSGQEEDEHSWLCLL